MLFQYNLLVMAQITYGTQKSLRPKVGPLKIFLIFMVVMLGVLIVCSLVLGRHLRRISTFVDVTYTFASDDSVSLGSDHELCERVVKALKERSKKFGKQHGITHSKVTWQPETASEFHLTFYTQKDVSAFYEELIREGVLELRLVAERSVQTVTEENNRIPEGYEWVTYRTWQVKKSRVELELEEERLLLNIEPEMTVRHVKKAGRMRLPKRPIVYAIDIAFGEEDSKVFADVTEKYVGRRLAAVMDGRVLTAPRVEQKIEDGRVRIIYFRDPSEVKQIVDVLNCGALPVPLKIKDIEEVPRGEQPATE